MGDEAKKVGISMRFVPAGVSEAGKLRGAIVLTPIPDRNGFLLDHWPEEIQTTLAAVLGQNKKGRLLILATSPGADGSQVGLKARPLHDESDQGTEAGRAWRALLAPDWWTEPPDDELLGLLRRAITWHEHQEHGLDGAVQALFDPWAVLARQLGESHSGQRIAAFYDHSAAPARAGVRPVSVLSSMRAASGEALRHTHTMRLMDEVARANGIYRGLAWAAANQPVSGMAKPAAATVKADKFLDFRTPAWSGLADLYRDNPGIEIRSSADPWEDAVVRDVKRRGFRKRSPTGTPRQASKNPFQDYVWGEAQPDLSRAMESRLRTAVSDQQWLHGALFVRRRSADYAAGELRRIALAATRPLEVGRAKAALASWASQFGRIDSAWSAASLRRAGSDTGLVTLANRSFEQDFVDLLHGSKRDALGRVRGVLQTAAVLHLATLRPDPPIYANPTKDRARPNSQPDIDAMTDDQREKLKALADQVARSPERRFFGLFAYPSLARALKLVIDVELEASDSELEAILRPVALAPNPRNRYIWLAPTLQAYGTSEAPTAAGGGVWTAAKWRRSSPTEPARFTPYHSQEEAQLHARAIATRIGEDQLGIAPSGSEPLQADGLLNLGVQLAQTSAPRFVLASEDQIAHMEQTLNTSSGQANAERTGAGLEDRSVGSPKTTGLVLLDQGRAQDIEDELARAAEMQETLANGTPIALFAEDLTAGYCVDVYSRSRRADARPEWRSLMARSVGFGPIPQAQGGAIDIEGLVDQALRNSAPGGNVRAYRRHLDEATFKLPARVIPEQSQKIGEELKMAQAIAEETVLVWHGDPLGAAAQNHPFDGRTPDLGGGVRSALDLPLSVEFGLPADGERPPRQEIAAGVQLAARAVYLGGVAATLAEALPRYKDREGEPALTTPRGTDLFTFLRHESVGAPSVALLHQGSTPPRDVRGDALNSIIVRSDPDDRARYQTPRSRRVVLTRGVPQAFAAMHPTGEAKSGHQQSHQRRILDGAPRYGDRPLGGLVNVRLDPSSGGLPVLTPKGGVQAPARPTPERPAAPPPAGQSQPEGVLKIQQTSPNEIAARVGHYYPDPAASSLKFEVLTRRRKPEQVQLLSAAIYSDRHWQALPSVGGDRSAPCLYPHAMPVLLEVETISDALANLRGDQILVSDDRRDIGTLDEAGRFEPLAARNWQVRPSYGPWTPHDGTLTVRRVRARLAPGEAYNIRAWSGVREGALSDWFAGFQQMKSMLTLYGAQALTLERQAQTFDPLEYATGRLLGIIREKGEKPTDTNPLPTAEEILAQGVVNAPSPIPSVAEVNELTILHAVARPLRPSFVCSQGFEPADPSDPFSEAETAGLLLRLVKKTLADETAWEEWLRSHNLTPVDSWATENDIGAVKAWFGGQVALSLAQTGVLALEASFRDVHDGAERRLPRELRNGRPVFPLVTRELWRTPPLADDRPAIPAAQFGQPDVIDLSQSLEGEVRNLFHPFEDARARRLLVRLKANSRFTPMMRAPSEPEGAADTFTARSAFAAIWLPATKRPDPMSDVELLPSFAWTLEGGRRKGRKLTRTKYVRVQWRRRRKVVEGEPDGHWFSSGEGERFALVFPPATPTRAHALAPDDITWRGRSMTRFARDAIRIPADKTEGRIFGWQPPAQSVDWPCRLGDEAWSAKPGQFCKQAEICRNRWMPRPASPDDEPISPANPEDYQLVDLVAFHPKYDPREDRWYVDLQIDAEIPSSTYLTLGMVRFQPHSIIVPGAAANLPLDLAVSAPEVSGLPLEATRVIEISSGRDRKRKQWYVDVIISGPLAEIRGGNFKGPLKDKLAANTPQFTLRILEGFSETAYEERSSEMTALSGESDVPFEILEIPRPKGAILARRLYADRNLRASPHFLFVQEIERMLPAVEPNGQPIADLVDARFPFFAKVRIR